MEKTTINEKSLVGDIVDQYPQTVDTLYSLGMHCLGCPASQAESLADACAVHGLDPAPVIEALKEKIAQGD
ncbi:MAG: DUF1858 domain-containing protein [Tissierellia bacterium]|nr:DUF1858 domain-containing protein [Tissierellia bacterium]